MANGVNVNKNYIPQIDYVSRDYTAILADLTAVAKQFNPTWAVSDPADIGVAILETFAYLGDILSFYTDRMASEGFIGTASQRASVLQIASMLGYAPTPSSSATVALSVTNSTASSITIPAGTQIASTSIVDGQKTQVIFETDTEQVIGANTTVSPVYATQGKTIADESLGTSNGTPSQAFKLSNQNVTINSSGSNITVKVGGVPYSYSSSLVDNTPYDSVFTTSMDSEGFTYVIFGDGIGGKIPPATYSITSTYRVGVGADGNVAAGTLASTFLGSYNVSVTQLGAATGGADAESTDSIRINAPRALRTLRRAVSLKDYAYLALQVSGVAKSSADSSVWSNVNLYIAPFGSSAVNIYGPKTGITSVTQTSKTGTAGTGYLKFSASNGTFNDFVAGVTYVTVSGASPVDYNVVGPTLVEYVDTTNYSFFTVATSLTTFPAYVSGTAAAVGVGSNTAGFDLLSSTVIDYFTDKVAPNVSLNVLPPTYIPINLDMSIRVLPQYSRTAVTAQVEEALSNLVSYNNAFFADRITPHLLINAVSEVDGVDYANVDHLRRASNDKPFYITKWSRPSSTTVKLTLANTSIGYIKVGDLIRISGVRPEIDGFYTTLTTNGTEITVTVPASKWKASYSLWNPANPTDTSLILGNTGTASDGIVVGMLIQVDSPNAFGTGVNTAKVTSVSGSSIGINTSVNTGGISQGTAVYLLPDATNNYVKVSSVDSELSDGEMSQGIFCLANEMPTKNIFNITAFGGTA